MVEDSVHSVKIIETTFCTDYWSLSKHFCIHGDVQWCCKLSQGEYLTQTNWLVKTSPRILTKMKKKTLRWKTVHNPGTLVLQCLFNIEKSRCLRKYTVGQNQTESKGGYYWVVSLHLYLKWWKVSDHNKVLIRRFKKYKVRCILIIIHRWYWQLDYSEKRKRKRLLN